MYPPKLPGGGGVEYFGFQVTGMTEWGQKSNPPPKSLGPPTKPQKYHAEFLSRSSLSLVEIRSTPLGLNSDYNHKDFLEFLTSQHSQQSKIYISSHTIKLRSNGS